MHIKIAEPVTIFASYRQFFGKKHDFIYFMMTSSIFLQKNVAKMFLDVELSTYLVYLRFYAQKYRKIKINAIFAYGDSPNYRQLS